MRTPSTIWALLLILVITMTNAFSQTSSEAKEYFFPGKHKYSKAIIYLDNQESTTFEASSLIIRDDVLSMKTKASFQLSSGSSTPGLDVIPLSEVYLIKASKGTKMVQYAIFGTLIGSATGFLVAIQAYENTQNQALMQGKTVTNEDEVIRNVTIGGAVIGLVVGAALGSGKHIWQTIYHKDASSGRSLKLDYSFAFVPQSKGLLLSLNISR